MKHTCPRCRQPTISGFAKRWSDRGMPAECGSCGGLSHVLASTSSGIGVGTVLLLIVCLVVAAGAQSVAVAVVGFGLTVVLNLWLWQRAELIPIPKENAAAAKKVSWFVACMSMLALLLGG